MAQMLAKPKFNFFSLFVILTLSGCGVKLPPKPDKVDVGPNADFEEKTSATKVSK